MHSLHGHTAFAHGGGAALHRTRTDVARGENAGAARLHRSRWAPRGFPCGGISDCGACFYEASVIALDLRRSEQADREVAQAGSARASRSPAPFAPAPLPADGEEGAAGAGFAPAIGPGIRSSGGGISIPSTFMRRASVR